MKIILIVPDCVVVRNYLYSNFIKELEQKNFEIIIFHQIPQSAINEIIKVNPNLKSFHHIDNFKENFLARTIREIIVYARILYNIKVFKNKTIRLFWDDNRKGFKRKVLYKISKILGLFLSKFYSFILFSEKLYDYLIYKQSIIKNLEQKILDINPDLVLNLHQRSTIASPIVVICKKNKIKTATTFFSWDNVPKARLVNKYNYYFVWSELMKQDVKIAYPEIKSNDIIVTGTPQFEFYFNEDLKESKTIFFNRYGLDIAKKTICYSSNDASSPYDPVYFDNICEEILKIDKEKRPQIIFRINPFDKTKRFDKVLEKYKSIIFNVTPDWQTESKNETRFINIYANYNDNKVLLNTVLHSDLVINFGSTMAHDFAVLDKPCLYLNYDVVENPTLKVNDVYQFQHFKSMGNIKAVGWINSKSEINETILETLNEPNKTGKDRKKWMEIIVKHPLDKNSLYLANEIYKICTFV